MRLFVKYLEAHRGHTPCQWCDDEARSSTAQTKATLGASAVAERGSPPRSSMRHTYAITAVAAPVVSTTVVVTRDRAEADGEIIEAEE